MSFIKEYDDAGSWGGYFDTVNRVSYWVSKLCSGGHPNGPASSVYRIFALHSGLDSVRGPMKSIVSRPFGTKDEAFDELERLITAIKRDREPRWGVGIDHGAAPDCAVDIIVDRETGRAVSIGPVEPPAPSSGLRVVEFTEATMEPAWVGGWRGGGRYRFRSLVQYDTIRNKPMLAEAQIQSFTDGCTYTVSGYDCLDHLTARGFATMELAQDACEKAIIEAIRTRGPS